MTSVFTLKIQIAIGILSILTPFLLYIWYHIYVTNEGRKAEKKHLENPDGYGYAFRRKMSYLNELTFMDSTGIGMLLGRYKKLKKIGVPMYIENPTVNVEKMLVLAGIYEVIKKI